MDIAEIRRRNLRSWIDNDPHSLGNVEAWCLHYSNFADKPITPSYIRQLVPERGTATRNIGEKVARRLEAAGGKQSGWLDLPTLDNDKRDADHAEAPVLLLSSNSASEKDPPKYAPHEERMFFGGEVLARFARLTPEGQELARTMLIAGIAEAERQHLVQANAS